MKNKIENSDIFADEDLDRESRVWGWVVVFAILSLCYILAHLIKYLIWN